MYETTSLSEEAEDTNYIDSGVNRLSIEPTIYCTLAITWTMGLSTNNRVDILCSIDIFLAVAY